MPVTLSVEEKKYLLSKSHELKSAMADGEQEDWYERFWIAYFMEFPVAANIVDRAERKWIEDCWKKVSLSLPHDTRH